MGKSFSGTEFDEGKYKVPVPGEYLIVGNAFRLEIETSRRCKTGIGI